MMFIDDGVWCSIDKLLLHFQPTKKKKKKEKLLALFEMPNSPVVFPWLDLFCCVLLNDSEIPLSFTYFLFSGLLGKQSLCLSKVAYSPQEEFGKHEYTLFSTLLGILIALGLYHVDFISASYTC